MTFGTYENHSYDAAERTTSISSGGTVRTFNWNEDDRLVSLARTGQPTTSYAYNGLGTRVSKANSNGSRVYKRDGAHVTASVLSDSVSTMVPGISERSGGTTRHQLADYLGSVKKLTSGGSVTDSMEYDAFGAAVSRTGTTNTQAGFAGSWGYQTDAESEYQLLGHRYYDPATGRFLTRDPIRDGRNWYGYCENNPLKAVDPEGLNLTVIGNNNGVGFDWAAENVFGVGGTVLKQPSKAVLIEAIINQPEGAWIMLWGHGYPGGFWISDNETLTTADVEYIAQERKRRKLGPLGGVILRSCNTCEQAQWINAWLKMSKAVRGYTTVTTDGFLEEWRKPVSINPVPRPWGNPFGKGKKKSGKKPKGTPVGIK